MPDDDPVARLRAEMDQARAGSREFAGTVWAFYEALVTSGFDETQAFGLTVAWMASLLGSAS